MNISENPSPLQLIPWVNGQGVAYNPERVSCIIPPQVIPGGQAFIEIDCENAYYTYKAPASGLDLKEGKEYIFTISLKDKNIELGQPTIAPWTQVLQEGDAK